MQPGEPSPNGCCVGSKAHRGVGFNGYDQKTTTNQIIKQDGMAAADCPDAWLRQQRAGSPRDFAIRVCSYDFGR